MSCCCSHCMHNIGECLFKDYADNWEFCSVLGHTKSELKLATNDLHQKYYEQVSRENTQNVNAGVMKSGMVLPKRQLCVMQTVTKMPKIDESVMQNVMKGVNECYRNCDNK